MQTHGYKTGVDLGNTVPHCFTLPNPYFLFTKWHVLSHDISENKIRTLIHPHTPEMTYVEDYVSPAASQCYLRIRYRNTQGRISDHR